MSVRTDVINLIVNVNGNEAQSQLNNLKKKAQDIKLEMEGLKKGTQEYISAADSLKALNLKMTELKQTIGITSLTQKELVAELNKLNALKGSVTPFSKEFKDLQVQIDAVKNRLYDVKNGVQGFASFFSKINDQVKQFGVLAAGYLGFQFITTQFQNIIQGAGKLSDQLADLRRVAGLTAQEAQTLNSALGKIDTRTSVSNLRDIAVVAGKLGVAKEDIFSFTKAVDQLVVALGDELGNADEITTQLGKILNVFDGKITGDNISKLGNAIVDLANKGVATGGFVVDFTQRLSGLAKTSNLSLAAVLGFGAGLEENGAKVESAATAISKLINTIALDIPKAAKIAGQSADTFADLFAKKPQEALLAYAAGLQKNKGSFAEIAASFKDAGEEGARVVSTLATLGNKTDFFNQKIKDTGEALKSNDSITAAFKLKNETFGAQLEKLGKQFYSFINSSGVVSFFSSLVGGFSELIKIIAAIPGPLIKLTLAFGTLVVGITLFNSGMIESARASLLLTATNIRNTIVAYAYAAAIIAQRLATSAAIATQAAFITISNLLTGSINLSTAAVRLWSIAIKTGLGPIGLLLVAVGAIAGGVYELSNAFKSSNKQSALYVESLKKANEEISQQQSLVHSLAAIVKDKALSEDTQKKSLQDLIALNPEYLKGLTLENIAHSDGKRILDDFNTSLEKNANLKAASIIKDREFDKVVKLKSIQQELAIAQKSNTGFGDLSTEAQEAFSNESGRFKGFIKTSTSVSRTAFISDFLNLKISASDFKEANKNLQSEIDFASKNLTDATDNFLQTQKEKDNARREFLLHQITVNKSVLSKLKKDSSEFVVAQIEYQNSINKYYDEFGYKGTAKSKSDTKIDESVEAKRKFLELQIKNLKESYDKLNATDVKGQQKNLAQQQEFQKQLDALDGKTPKKTSSQKEYDSVLKEAEAFRKKIDELVFQSSQVSKDADQKEIDSVKHKYAEILKEYDVLVKKLHGKTDIIGPRAAITVSEDKELSNLNAKQQQSALTKSYEYELQASTQFYEEEKSRQAKRFVEKEISEKIYQANVAHIDEEAKKAQLSIAEEYSKATVEIDGKDVAAVKKAQDDITKLTKEQLDKRTADAIAAYRAQEAELKLIQQLNDSAATAKIETRITIAKTTGNADNERDAQRDLLAEQLRQNKKALEQQREDALASITETGAERTKKEIEIENDINAQKAKLNHQYLADVQSAEDEAAQRKVSSYQNLFDQLTNIASEGFQIINNLDNKNLSKEKAANDAKANQYKKLLDHKLISQKQYDTFIAKQDADYAKKKHAADVKAFKQQQALAITAALINGALAITSTLSARPGLADIFTLGVARAIQVGLVVGATALQVGAIASQSPPEAGKGKLLSDGPYHHEKEKGLHVVNPRTGKTELLLEKDEMVIKGSATRDNKTYTVTGTPAQIGSKLNSMHGGVTWAPGAKVEQPKWVTSRPAQINTNMPKIMEQGGIIRPIASFDKENVSSTSEPMDLTQLLSVMQKHIEISEEHLNVSRQKQERLHAIVSLRDIRGQEAILDKAKRASGINGK